MGASIILFLLTALIACLALLLVVSRVTGLQLLSVAGVSRIVLAVVVVLGIILLGSLTSTMVQVVGQPIDAVYDLLRSVHAVVLLAGITFGVLFGIYLEDKVRLQSAVTDDEKKPINKRLTYESVGLVVVAIFGLVGAILSEPLGRFLSRFESIPTPYGELRLRTSVVPGLVIDSPGETTSGVRGPVRYIANAAILAELMDQDRGNASDVAAHLKLGNGGQVTSTIERIAPSRRLIAAFRKAGTPLFVCATALFRPTLTISTVELKPVVPDLRMLARFDLDDSTRRRVLRRLTLHALRAFDAVTGASRLAGGESEWRDCADLLNLVDPDGQRTLDLILAECAPVAEDRDCRTAETQAAFDRLFRRVMKATAGLDAVERAYASFLLQQLLAMDGDIFAAAVEGDRWLLDAQKGLAAAASIAPDPKLQKWEQTVLRIRIITMRGYLIEMLRKAADDADGVLTQLLSEEYVSNVRQQLTEIRAVLGESDLDGYYKRGPCVSEEITDDYDGLLISLRDRHTLGLGNLLYGLTSLDEFEKAHAQEVHDKAILLDNYLQLCVGNESLNSERVELLETVGTAYLHLLLMSVRRSPEALDDSSDLLQRARRAYRLCRDYTRDLNLAAASVTLNRPIAYRLDERAQIALGARCETGLQKIREVRDLLL